MGILSPKKKGAVGRKQKIIDEDEIVAVPVETRSTHGSLAHELEVSASLVSRYIQRGKLVVKSSSVKPRVTDINKLKRIHFVLSNIEGDAGAKKFKIFYDRIHVDEKWFYITKVNRKAV